jgi:hypothetical protein
MREPATGLASARGSFVSPVMSSRQRTKIKCLSFDFLESMVSKIKMDAARFGASLRSIFVLPCESYCPEP